MSHLMKILALGLLLFTMSQACRAEKVSIAAASDLKFALEEIAASFRKNTGHQVMLTFGSSGTLASQIRHGAPFHLFLSADEGYIHLLEREGLTLGQGDLYALGRIALMTARQSPLQVDGELKGLSLMLDANKISRFAIANPEHAPYGQRAQEALRYAGLWDRIRHFLVYGENVSQAAQYALSGSAEGGIVALSIAKSPQLAGKIRYAVIPSSWHRPLWQRMVLMKNANAASRAFYAHLQSKEARTVMQRYGFTLPINVEPAPAQKGNN